MANEIYYKTWWGNPTTTIGSAYYEYAYPTNYGSELLTNSDMSSVSWPWNYGSWSNASPTTDGDIATIEVIGGNYPSVNPRIEQSIATTSGTNYHIDALINSNGNDVQVLVVDPNNGFNLIGQLTKTTSGYESFSFDFQATSANSVVQILIQGNLGNTILVDSVSIKEIL